MGFMLLYIVCILLLYCFHIAFYFLIFIAFKAMRFAVKQKAHAEFF